MHTYTLTWTLFFFKKNLVSTLALHSPWLPNEGLKNLNHGWRKYPWPWSPACGISTLNLVGSFPPDKVPETRPICGLKNKSKGIFFYQRTHQIFQAKQTKE